MSNYSNETDLHGHERRLSKRVSQRKEAIQQSKDICNDSWQSFCTDNMQSSISDEDIIKLYDSILEQIQQEIQTKYIPFALFERKRFFEKVNKERQLKNLDQFPQPIIASRIQRPKNLNDFDNFQYLSQAQDVVDSAINIWQKKNRFSLLECVGWFLFSMITFSGYSDEKVLKAIYEYLLADKPIYQLFGDKLCLPLNIESSNYANQVIVSDDSTETLFHSRLIVIDDISRLWLFKLQSNINSENFPKYRDVVRKLGEFTHEKFTITTIQNSKYLHHISIYWQTLPNVRLDVQLVEVLNGTQQQTFISEDHLLRYFTKIKLPIVALIDDDIERLIIQPSTELKTTANRTQVFKSDIVKEIRSILNADKKTIKTGLNRLLAEPLFPNQERLVNWMIDLYISGNKISTLKRYLSDVGNGFIANTRDTDFLGWTKHNYQFVYDDILSDKNQHRVGFTRNSLRSLHNSLKKHYYAPHVDLQGKDDPLMVSSYLIPSYVYQLLQESLLAQKDLSHYNKQMVGIVTALLYRTGMRISEILGLQISDIEYDNQAFSDYNIIVRSNPYRSLKSDDGTRRICLSVLLHNSELEQFKKLFYLKQSQSSRNLFTLDYQSNPISRHSIEQPIKKLLAETVYSDIKLHAFRHNAISNMAVILRSDPKLATHFTDYNEDQIELIKQHFLGEVRTVSTNYWDALMEFAGHANLTTTFSSYIHTADIIASYQLQQASLTLPLGIVNKLIGTSRDKIYQHNKKAVDARNDKVYLGLIRHYLNRTIDTVVLDTNKGLLKPAVEVNKQHQLQPAKESAVFGRYSREKIAKLLQDIEEGQSVSEASSLNFIYDDALNLYDKAMSLVTDSEGKPVYKLISKNRKRKSEHVLIAPTPLHYHEEKALVNLCFDNLEELYQDKGTRREIKEMLIVFYEKVNTSKSEIRFKFKEKNLFNKYLKVMCLILTSEHWRVNINSITYKTYVDDKKKRIVNSFVDKKFKSKVIADFNSNHPHFDGKITTTDNYNGYSLSLISPVKISKSYSSALMRYVLHFLIIVDELSD